MNRFTSTIIDTLRPFSLSIGSGIGQSRLCMYFLNKAHIGEIQSSIWPEKMKKQCQKNGIVLL